MQRLALLPFYATIKLGVRLSRWYSLKQNILLSSPLTRNLCRRFVGLEYASIYRAHEVIFLSKSGVAVLDSVLHPVREWLLDDRIENVDDPLSWEFMVVLGIRKVIKHLRISRRLVKDSFNR